MIQEITSLIVKELLYIHTWTTILVIELPTQEGTSKGVVYQNWACEREKNQGPEGVIIEVYKHAKGTRYV